MNFDATIGLGEIVAILSIIGSLWAFHKQNVRRLHRLEFKVNLMWKRFAQKFRIEEDLEEKEID